MGGAAPPSFRTVRRGPLPFGLQPGEALPVGLPAEPPPAPLVLCSVWLACPPPSFLSPPPQSLAVLQIGRNSEQSQLWRGGACVWGGRRCWLGAGLSADLVQEKCGRGTVSVCLYPAEACCNACGPCLRSPALSQGVGLQLPCCSAKGCGRASWRLGGGGEVDTDGPFQPTSPVAKRDVC